MSDRGTTKSRGQVRVPDRLRVKGEMGSATAYRGNKSLLEELGLTSVVNAASQQAAGRIGLFNNPVFLMESEFRTIQMGRDFRLRSFNDYREAFGYRRLPSYPFSYTPLTTPHTRQNSDLISSELF